MPGLNKKAFADVPAGSDSPLAFAVSSRDSETISMVTAAVEHKQVLLAYQPVMQARDQSKIAFYEGLIRVLDATGRVIPAGAFMNAIETSGPFIGATVAAILAGATPFWVNLFASVFIVARVAVAYVHIGTTNQPMRSALWSVGLLCILVLAVMAIVAVF